MSSMTLDQLRAAHGSDGALGVLAPLYASFCDQLGMFERSRSSDGAMTMDQAKALHACLSTWRSLLSELSEAEVMQAIDDILTPLGGVLSGSPWHTWEDVFREVFDTREAVASYWAAWWVSFE